MIMIKKNKKKSYLPEKNVLQYSPKKRKKKNTFKVVYISAIILVVLLGGCIFFIFKSQFFRVSKISVSGNRLLGSEEVVSALSSKIAENSFFVSLLPHENILFWVFADSDYVFSYPPELEGVNLNVNFSDKKVYINVLEFNVKHIICKSKENVCYGLTEEGIVFSKIPEVKGSLILKIEDESEEPVILGSPYFENLNFIKNISETNLILERSDLKPFLIRVRSISLNEWEAVFKGDFLMYFSGDFIPQNLPLVLSELKVDDNISMFEYVDFRVKDKVFYK